MPSIIPTSWDGKTNRRGSPSKTIDFVKDEDIPRTPTGKILHRMLREKYSK